MKLSFSLGVTRKSQYDAVASFLQEHDMRVFVSYSSAVREEDEWKKVSGDNLYLRSPRVFRKKDEELFSKVLSTGCYRGVLTENQEVFFFLGEEGHRFGDPEMIPDSCLYVWNREALFLYGEYPEVKEHFLPLELKGGELRALVKALGERYPHIRHSSLVYGRIPMMVSSNCIAGTAGNCKRSSGFTSLTDRKDMVLPVFRECETCCNIIYNALPLSLHDHLEELGQYGDLLIDLTDETPEECLSILRFFLQGGERPYEAYTTGHYKRGVE